MEPNAYLQRFQAEFTNHTIENLSQLQRLHMQHVPFENLDVIRRVPIYLNHKLIYDKVINRNRGGYCYEVNGLFRWLLNELGYNAHHVAATVKRPNGKFARPNTHVAIIVELDQPYLVDVGFGDSNYEPLPLDGSEQTDVSGTYKVQQMDNQMYDLMRKEDSRWRTLYRFSLDERKLVDFHEGVVFNQVSKQSSFTHHDLVTMATEEGRITLRDHTLTTTINGERQVEELTYDEKAIVLNEIFKISI